MPERLFWIDIHYSCFGIVAVGDTVTIAPPIAAWMIGKGLTEIKPFLKDRKAVVVEVKSPR